MQLYAVQLKYCIWTVRFCTLKMDVNISYKVYSGADY